MRERLSGAVILIALAVIFVPMLFDEPAPRSERPKPVMTIEQPVEVERRDLPDPEPPSSLGQIQSPSGVSSPDQESSDDRVAPETEQADEAVAETSSAEAPGTESAGAPADDPIAELARAADQRLSSQAEQASREAAETTPEGEWAVQVGSFGEPSNAERLESNLAAQGLPVYSRVRDNGLTTVYVGPYATSREGEEVMAELKAESNLQGLLVRAGN
ncbi:MAG: SPOR domain-containing protein [Halomonas sp.]|uniref:SPOR domain-containing protein n=1 Tax=Halomonas sp. TaxID=1486246 RepID=UPI002ACD9A6C|nr:SPOR domain-containing protein [Halomonas sp.]MDZ7853129.1 SPOR domain-containing protein [Halomonas sp.]